MARNEELYTAVCSGNNQAVKAIVQAAIDEGSDLVELMNESMIPAMREVGDKFSRCEVFVPDMLIAARAMQSGLGLIEPLLGADSLAARTKVAVGTVKVHDIGKNLVAMMLKGAGYDVIDLGVDCEAAKFEEAVNDGVKILMCSALLTTTMPYIKEVVDHFKDRDDVKIIIGGAPVTQEYAEEVGATGYGKDANDAVTVLERVLVA